MITGYIKDKDGNGFEKSGEFGCLVIGGLDGKVDVEYTTQTKDQLAFLIASMIKLVGMEHPEIVTKALALTTTEKVKIDEHKHE